MSADVHGSERWTPRPGVAQRPAAAPASASTRSERRQFLLMVALAFPLLLGVALIARLSGWRWQPWPPGRDAYRSVFHEAKAAAETYIGFAFVRG